MESAYLDIDSKWGVIVCYDYDTLDHDDIWAICKTFGMSDKNIRKALSILSAYNTGMTVSNPDIRMSVIFVSSATSPSEWWNTAVHELKHTADAIIRYYGVDWDGEDAAYITGYLTKQLVEKVSEPCY
jgi:hypothetical protein